jgi:hypothetical protein
VVGLYSIAFFSEQRLALTEVFQIHYMLFQLAGKGYNFLCQCVLKKFVMPLVAVGGISVLVAAEIAKVVVDLYEGVPSFSMKSGLNILGRC